MDYNRAVIAIFAGTIVDMGIYAIVNLAAKYAPSFAYIPAEIWLVFGGLVAAYIYASSSGAKWLRAELLLISGTSGVSAAIFQVAIISALFGFETLGALASAGIYSLAILASSFVFGAGGGFVYSATRDGSK